MNIFAKKHKLESLRIEISEYISTNEMQSFETQLRFEAIKNNLIINDYLVQKYQEKLNELKSK